MSEIPSVFLFLGPEDGLKSDEIASLRQRVEKSSGEKPDEHHFYLPDDPIQKSVEVLRNGSLFSAHRLVIIHAVDRLRKKADLDPLLDYLAAPNPDSTLVLTSDAVRIDAKLEKKVPGEHRKVFWEMFDNQKSSWVIGYFRKHHVSIDSDAVDLFLEVVENNTKELRSEAEKLCTFVGPGGTVGVEEIDTFVYHSREESVFTLFGHITGQNLEASLTALDKLVTSGESGPVQIIGGLVFQLRRLLALRLMIDNDVSFETAFGRLNIRGKRIQREYRAAVEKYRAGQLEASIQTLVEYDALFRSQRPGIHRCLLDLMIYQLFYASTRLVRVPSTTIDAPLIGDISDDLILIR